MRALLNYMYLNVHSYRFTDVGSLLNMLTWSWTDSLLTSRYWRLVKKIVITHRTAASRSSFTCQGLARWQSKCCWKQCQDKISIYVCVCVRKRERERVFYLHFILLTTLVLNCNINFLCFTCTIHLVLKYCSPSKYLCKNNYAHTCMYVYQLYALLCEHTCHHAW